MTKKSKIIIATFVGLVLVAFLLFKFLSPKSEPEKITIGYSQLRISLPIFVAQEKGLFKKYGLDVELKPYPTAQPMMEALVSGNIDVAGYCALPITFGTMAKSTDNKELVFISAILEDDSRQISKLIAKANARIDSIKDLKGKRIGILPTRAYEVRLKQILESNGLDVDKDQIIIQQVAPDLQKDALEKGTIQALFSNDPMTSIIISKGIGKDLSPDINLLAKTTGISPFYFGSFNVSKKFADANSDVTKKISLALDEAIDFINNDYKSAYVLMGKYFDPKFANLTDKYPKPFFKKTNEISNTDLIKMRQFYFENKILAKELPLTNAQFERK